MEAESQKLYRNTQAGVLAGVCAGLAEYFRVDTVWIRLIFVLSVFLGLSKIGFIIPVLYVVLWIVLPIKPFRLFPDEKDDPVIHHFSDLPEYEERSDIDSAPVPRKPVLGIILLGIGILLLLIQLDYLNFRELSKYWPLIFIVLGISIIVTSFKRAKDKSIRLDSELKEEENEN